MAIKINFLTQFDNRGIKKAQRDLAGIGRNIGRTFDLAIGAGIAGAVAGLAKSVQSLARIETINRQTETAIASMGNAAGISATEVGALADQLEKLTATEAETIQQGANLLLTFGNIRNEAGAGNDIFNQTVKSMVDLGRAMGQDASSSAIQLGKALNDPTKGVAALTRVGVSFSQQQKDQIKTLQQSGDVMGAQKIILAELQKQFGGSGAAFAKTFQGQVELLGHEIGTLGEDIASDLMPSLQMLVGQIRELAPEIGERLKNAFASIDFKPMLDFVVFFISNIDKIFATVATIFALSKAFAALKIAMDLATVATALFNGTLALNPYVAVAAGLALVVAGLVAVGTEAYKAKVEYEKLNGEQVRFGGGILDKQRRDAAAATKGMQPYIPSNYGIGAGGAIIGATDKVKTPVKVDPIFQPPKGGASSVKKTAGQIAAEKVAAALKKAQAALKDFQGSLKELSSGFEPLTRATSNLGEFQQTVVDTFDSINKKIAEGVANKTIASKGLDNLRNFLKAQQNLLEENARQRDAIIEKRSLAKALFDDVKSSLMGTGSLASLLETQTRQVTKSVTKIVDGFTVTTRQTVDEVVGGQGVVSKLKEVVARTKAFATQLTSLKALGLNPDLFKQIVDAGPEVGGQLANEILAGGSDSVKALNDTFTELQTVTASVAEQTAVVMFNAGIDIAGGLVNGLLAQEAALVAAAKTLADAFNAEFQARVNALQTPAMAETRTQTFKLGDLAKIDLKTVTGDDAWKASATLAKKLIASPQYTKGSQIVITVNAGVGTNGKTVGQAIQAELNKYAKSSSK
jgi:hypothetical protein